MIHDSLFVEEYEYIYPYNALFETIENKYPYNNALEAIREKYYKFSGKKKKTGQLSRPLISQEKDFYPFIVSVPPGIYHVLFEVCITPFWQENQNFWQIIKGRLFFWQGSQLNFLSKEEIDSACCVEEAHPNKRNQYLKRYPVYRILNLNIDETESEKGI